MIYCASLLLMLGSSIIFLSALGVFRFPDLFTRMHAGSKASSFGSALTLLALILFFPRPLIIIEALSIIGFIYTTAPVAAHMIARAAFMRGVKFCRQMEQNELEGRYDKKGRFLASKNFKKK